MTMVDLLFCTLILEVCELVCYASMLIVKHHNKSLILCMCVSYFIVETQMMNTVDYD